MGILSGVGFNFSGVSQVTKKFQEVIGFFFIKAGAWGYEMLGFMLEQCFEVIKVTEHSMNRYNDARDFSIIGLGQFRITFRCKVYFDWGW